MKYGTKKFIYYVTGIFVTCIILVIILEYYSRKSINQLVKGNKELLSEFAVKAELQKLETDIRFPESAILWSFISGGGNYEVNVEQKRIQLEDDLARLKSLSNDSSTNKLVADLGKLITEKINFNRQVVDSFIQRGKPSAERVILSRKGVQLTERFLTTIHQFDSTRQHQMTLLMKDTDSDGLKAKKWGAILAVLAAVAGVFTFWFIVVRIKKQEQLIQELNESERKLKEASTVKEHFMANMSHEIRTPLNAILGFTNLLERQRQPFDARVQTYIQAIQSSGESLLTIINDILDLSKIEAGMMRIEQVPFSFRALLHSVETMFTAKVKEKHLQLGVDVEEGLPDALAGDPVRLTQLLVNLVSNAIKFTEQGRIDIKAKKTGQDDGRIWLELQVQDTGVGIAPEKLNTIFERFNQGETDTTRKYGGTGLGLTIVKQLVELQNGKITVKSKPGQGSLFIIELPYNLASTTAAKAETSYIKEDEPGNKKNLKILVAEDNLMNQELIRHLLAEWNMDYEIVPNGKLLIEKLKTQPYSLVLMDIQMPEMDGYTATGIIRSQLRSDIPVIAMTAHAMAGEKEKCLSYGMNDYISKPIREDILYELIRRYTGLSKEAAKNSFGENDKPLPRYSIINTDYLNELSKGRQDFQVAMAKQFIVQLPIELEEMRKAMRHANYIAVKAIAHNMKTSVSFMGLTGKLNSLLENIEQTAIKNDMPAIESHVEKLSFICLRAVEEAKDFVAAVS